ncbi:MAG: phage portal protein [Planctomycetota bacterium]
MSSATTPPAGLWSRAKAALSVLRGGMSLDRWFREVEGGNDPQGTAGPRHPYDQVAAVYACVQMRANALATMPLRISTASEELVEDGPLVRLLCQPNPEQTWRDFVKTLSATIDLAGRTYLVFDEGRSAARRREPNQIAIAHPEQIRPRRNPRTGELLGYRFRPAGAAVGVTVDLDADAVACIREPDYDQPSSKDAAVSPLAATRLAVSQYFKADLANEASLDNSVEPGGVFTMDGTPGEGQVEDVKKQIYARQGAKNRRRNLVLWGGMKWERIAAAFSEMEFAELKRMARQDICAGFGLHQLLVFPSDEGLSSGAMDDAEEIAWTTTHLSRAEWIAEQLTIAVISRFRGSTRRGLADARRRAMTVKQRHFATRGGLQQRALAFDLPYYVWMDPSSVPAIIRRIAKQTESIERMTKIGVPLNHAAALMGVPIEEQPWGNTWWRPVGLVNVADDTPGASAPGSDDPTGLPEDIGEPEVPEVGERQARAADAITRRYSEAQLRAIWESYRASLDGPIRAFRGPYRRHLMQLRAQTLANLNRLPADTAARGEESREAVALHWEEHEGDRLVARESVVRLTPKQRDLLGELVFDIATGTDNLLRVVGPVLRRSIELGGAQAMDEAAAAEGRPPEDADPFALDDPGVEARLRERDVRIADLTDAQARRLRAKLAEGLASNASRDELREIASKQFNVEARRADLVARQEVSTAVEEARHEGRKQAGVPAKSWLWSRRETGRDWHRLAEAETLARPVPLDAPFVLPQTGNTCQHPRGTGRAVDDINCGCTTISRYPGDRIREAALFDALLTRGVCDLDQLEKRQAQETNHAS